MAHVICGVDIVAETLDTRIGRDGAWQQFVRTNDSIDRLAAFCRTHQAGLVVMEATGGYERLRFHRLWAAEIPVAIVNPRSVRQFAEAIGTIEKTDKIDAGMYARDSLNRPDRRPPVSRRGGRGDNAVSWFG